MAINNKTFSENLIKIRKQKGFSQKDIANVVGITEVTLRSRYKELVTKLNIKN